MSGSDRPAKGVILAAGEGTRLRPLTLQYPKVMLPVCGVPLLELTIRHLASNGIRDIAVNLHHMPETVTGHFGDGRRLGVNLHYSSEEELLGTAGALGRLKGFLDGRFVLVFGDILTDLPLGLLIARHAEHRRRDSRTLATMVVHHVQNPAACGILSLDEDNRVIRFAEKPPPEEVFSDLANAGVLILEPGVLEWIPDGEFRDIGFHLIPDLLACGRSVYGWVLPDDAYLIDIGTPEKYLRAQQDWPAARGGRQGARTGIRSLDASSDVDPLARTRQTDHVFR